MHVFDRPGQYVATVRVTIAMPLIAEPRDIEGVATIMSRTLDEGTELHPANEFAAALERHGAAYGVDVSSDALHVEISVPVSPSGAGRAAARGGDHPAGVQPGRRRRGT